MPEGRPDDALGCSLTEHQKNLRDSWAVAAQPGVQAGNKLFKTLFQIAPEVATYFSSSDISADDFQEHISLVMGTIDSAIKNLNNLTGILPDLQRLGSTHASLGVKKEYFIFFKKALLTTFAQELQEAFTEECRAAWAQAFDVIELAIQSGM